MKTRAADTSRNMSVRTILSLEFLTIAEEALLLRVTQRTVYYLFSYQHVGFPLYISNYNDNKVTGFIVIIAKNTFNMRYLSLLLIALSICLTACNHNDELPTQVNLPITEQFVPGNIIFSMSDTEFKDKVRPWMNKQLVVNSKEEIPNDPLGFPESYYKINFTYNTLLLCYQIHDYNVVSYTNRYYRNTVENTYNWSINLGISGEIEGDNYIISRYAILVPKLPTDAKVEIWHGLTDHNWDWDKN